MQTQKPTSDRTPQRRSDERSTAAQRHLTGSTPVAGIAAYAGAKGGLSAFTESIGNEVRPLGVSVQVLYPGFVLTPMGDAAIASGLPLPPRSARRSPEQVADLMIRKMGGRRRSGGRAPG